jgi:hypothetical protein
MPRRGERAQLLLAVRAEPELDALQHVGEERSGRTGTGARADLLVVEHGEHGDVRGIRSGRLEGDEARVHGCQIVQATRCEESVVLSEHGAAGGVGGREVVPADARCVDAGRRRDLGEEVGGCRVAEPPHGLCVTACRG